MPSSSNNTFTILIVVIVVILIGVYVFSSSQDEESSNTGNTIVTLQTTLGTITLELFTEDMPITTDNFLTLIQNNFYNNTKFHRVIPDFMIQGGDPITKDDTRKNEWGGGGPGYTIEDEFVSDERLSNVRGTIAMANTGQPNSGGSQFFINVVDNTGLDFDKEPSSSKHPVFGRVIEGMSVVDAIVSVPTEGLNIPVEPIVIEKIIIE